MDCLLLWIFQPSYQLTVPNLGDGKGLNLQPPGLREVAKPCSRSVFYLAGLKGVAVSRALFLILVRCQSRERATRGMPSTPVTGTLTVVGCLVTVRHVHTSML